MAKGRPSRDLQRPPHFTFRTPLLPFEVFARWADDCRWPALDADDSTWQEAVEAARPALCAHLADILRQPHVRDALFLASPGLHEQLDDWLQRPDTARARKVEWALTRYVARMAGRCTPFGLFSGISVGRVTPQSQLAVGATADYRRHTRLDNDYLFALTDWLSRDRAVRDHLSWRPNSSIFRSGQRLRYVEARLDGKRRSHHLVKIDPDEYLDATLARAAAGATARSLAQALVADDPEIAEDEASDFIDELIDCQLLVSRLTPAVTGREPIHGIIGELESVPEAPMGERSAGVLAAVRDALTQLDHSGLGAPTDHYRAIAQLLEPLSVEIDLARLFQVDMVKPAPDATLGERVLAEIERGVSLLHRLAETPENDPLRDFRDAFSRRYETREVPLQEALDEDSGIGFIAGGDIAADPSPLLRDLVFPGARTPAVARTGNVAWYRFLARRLHGHRRPADGPLELSDRDFEQHGTAEPLPLPDALSAMATLAARSPEALAAGDFQLRLMGAHGPSGARITGRFCHASPAVEQTVRAHLQAEEALRPEAVFAEIVHLPEGRIGNIMCRPVLRAHEIPFLGLSGAPREQQIALDDLYVSVVSQRIVLRSRRLGREVIPRLSTAHNLRLGVGVYRFLGYLQSQGLASLGWSWGPLADMPYLPRVKSGRLVLERARWSLDAAALRPLVNAIRSSAKQPLNVQRARVFRALQQLRATWELPRWVVLEDGDNELPVDLDNPLSCDSLGQLLKNRDRVVLRELFPAREDLACSGPEGRYAVELVVPYVASHARRQSPGRPLPGPVQRSFAPGSEWLYSKIYAGVGSLDRVLDEAIAPLCQTVTDQGIAHQWFFIRYADSEDHVRVRWRGQPERLTGELLPALHQALAPLLRDRVVWSLQLGTYEREVERYGGADGIELAEQLFHADSDAVLELLPYFAGDDAADLRWQMALLGSDALLDDLGFDLEQKLALLTRMRDSFGHEFNANASFYKRIGANYRPQAKSLMQLLQWPFRTIAEQPAAAAAPVAADEGDEDALEEEEDIMAACARALARRSRRMQPIARQLRELEDAGRLDQPLPDLASSYLHMYINRILRSAQRAQELVLYDYLRRLYGSLRARAQQAKRGS